MDVRVMINPPYTAAVITRITCERGPWPHVLSAIHKVIWQCSARGMRICGTAISMVANYAPRAPAGVVAELNVCILGAAVTACTYNEYTSKCDGPMSYLRVVI